MKRSKVLLGLVMTLVMFAIPASAFATTSHELGIVQNREDGYAYRIGVGSGGDARNLDLWKIVEYLNGGVTWNNAIYCIKGGPGFGGTITEPTDKRTYDVTYDMKKVGDIPSNYKSTLPSDTANTVTLNIGGVETEVSYTNYNAVLWILDNMYLPKHPDETQRQEMRDSLLKAAFKEQLEDADLVPPFEISQINLTDSDIEVIQQLAIWHFTNPDDIYNVGNTLPAIQISEKDSTTNYNTYSMESKRQEDAQTLYTYLVNNAMINANKYGTGENRHLTAPVQLLNTNLSSTYIDDDVVVGPFKIEKESELAYTLRPSVLNQNNEAITNYTLYKKGTEGKPVKAGETETIESLVGQEFYIAVPKTSNVTEVTLKLMVDYYESEANFWTVSGTNSEQPVVMVEKKLQTAEQKVGLNYNFDLALRKFITAVNKTAVTDRVPQVKVSENGKITYEHKKTPLVVESGDLVTYTIRIYNEGLVSGFAQEVKDDIPAGLKFLPNNETNKKYGWKLTEDGKSIVTDYLKKDDNNTNLLKAFDSKNMTVPDYKDVNVVFEVTEPNSSKNTIINTAEISDDADEHGKPIDDIDSTPNNNKDGEDDIDKEYIKLKEFDLALRKFITAVNDNKIEERVPQVKVDENGKITYTHPKTPVAVANGDIVIYTIRIYNEGQTDGYAKEITDDIPEGTEFIIDNEINVQYRWKLSADTKSVTTDYLSMERDEDNLLKAFNKDKMTTPEYKDVKIALKVTESNASKKILINTAEISDDADKNGKPVDDIDSTPGNNKDGEDDIDKEYIKLKEFDLALRKFITAVNDKEVTTRIPQVKVDENGKITYEHTKEPVLVANSDIVTYTIRIYNEGTISGYAESVRDDVPDGLEFLPDNETNKKYGWKLSEDGKSITTDYLSKDNSKDNLLKAFDNVAMKTPDYKDVKVAFKVTDKILPKDRVLVNTAEINDDTDENGKPVDDIDSTPGNNKDGEDDIDKEYVKVQYFDLALRKFITAVNDTEVTTRIPQVSVDENGKVTYTHTKEPVLVANSNIVTYTIRVFNEGTMDGYAESVRDDVPDGLEFLADNEINKQYGWKLSEDGKTITTDYLSKDKAEDNIIKAFDREKMDTPAYKDVKVAFKVTEEMLPGDRILINTAEINKDRNETDTPDIDSTPGNNKDGEDDIDKEYVKVQYFDLSLLKWVNKVIVTEDGETTERDTGHTGLENPEPIVKVELDRKKLKNTTVKFEYTIKITNEGEIAGYAKEISDYIPDGLEFIQADNPNWTEADGKVTTRGLEGTLLQPGESADVKIILTWINNSENMGVKTNVAEISEDYNEFGAKDIDSTPNNKVEGEDDIDDAPVMLSIKTGGATVVYFGLIGIVLATIAGGIILIKRYVL